MIEILLKDDFDNELQLHDVLLVHCLNQRVKYVGVLKFDTKVCQFLIYTDDNEFICFGSAIFSKLEKLGNIKEHPKLEQIIGRHHFKPGKSKSGLQAIYEAAFESNT